MYAGRQVKYEASKEQPVVFVIDDDAGVRDSMDSLIRSIGLKAKLFAAPYEFLAEPLPHAPCCLVLDVRLPRLSGLEFQAELAKANVRIPIIFITGHGDIPMTVRAMKAGALEFLTKPFRDQDLVDAIQNALERDKEFKDSERANASLWSRFESLTNREKQIMTLVTGGLMNKQVAGNLGVSEVTIKLHRANVMKKMGAGSFAELVKMADALQLWRQQGPIDVVNSRSEASAARR